MEISPSSTEKQRPIPSGRAADDTASAEKLSTRPVSGSDPKAEDRVRRVGRSGESSRWSVAPALLVILVFAPVTRVSEESPNVAVAKATRAQEIVDVLRSELPIAAQVQIVLVAYHPFVFAVESADARRESFQLSIEAGFLQMLTEEELRAALAHELGHVWIFTHHPFLQTERLANDIGQRLVEREDLVELYQKLWIYEGTEGVDMDQLLGPRSTRVP